jgi:hypothetical protein
MGHMSHPLLIWMKEYSIVYSQPNFMTLRRDSYVTSIDILHKFLGLNSTRGDRYRRLWPNVTSECPREYVTLILTFACWTCPTSNFTPEICVQRKVMLPQYIFELSQKLVPCKLYPTEFCCSHQWFFVSVLILAHYRMDFPQKNLYSER